MFAESPGVFLSDFGVSATWYSAPWIFDRDTGATLDSTQFGINGLQQQTALVLFDEPEHDILGGRVSSTAYQITYPTAQFVGIKHNDAVVVNGVKYSALQPHTLDDGVWSETELEAI